MIEVLLVDDQVLVRGGLSMILDAHPDIAIVGEVDGGPDAHDAIARLMPDLVLVDIQMAAGDGLETIYRIVNDPELSGVRVIVLTTSAHDADVFQSLHAGASGFLDKHCEPAELATAIRVAYSGDAVLSPRVTSLLVREFARHTKDTALPWSAALSLLTARERETAVLLASGLDNEQIAERLDVSLATVRTHLGRAITKLALRNRSQLVAFAYESGLIRAGWLTSASTDAR